MSEAKAAGASAWRNKGAAGAATSKRVITILIALLAFLLLSFIAFGYLMIRGAMPTWLGVVWVFCGLMFWLGHKAGLGVLLARQFLEPLGVQGFGQRALDQLDYWARTNLGDPMCMFGSLLRRTYDGPPLQPNP